MIIVNSKYIQQMLFLKINYFSFMAVKKSENFHSQDLFCF